jgi:hypothetical protein
MSTDRFLHPSLPRRPARTSQRDEYPRQRGDHTIEVSKVETGFGWRRRILAYTGSQPGVSIETTSPSRVSRVLIRRDEAEHVLKACALLPKLRQGGRRVTGAIQFADGARMEIEARGCLRGRLSRDYGAAVAFTLIAANGERRRPLFIQGEEIDALARACELAFG